jgi:hypothetical protein
MSLCILTNNDENTQKKEKVFQIILSGGKFIKITATDLDEKEHDKILDL